MHENKHKCTLAPLGLQSTCCLQKWPMVACQVLWQNKNKTKDHSPSMTLSELPKQNDQSPLRKFPKILNTIAIMVYTMTRACPVNILTQGCSSNTMVKQHC